MGQKKFNLRFAFVIVGFNVATQLTIAFRADKALYSPVLYTPSSCRKARQIGPTHVILALSGAEKLHIFRELLSTSRTHHDFWLLVLSRHTLLVPIFPFVILRHTTSGAGAGGGMDSFLAFPIGLAAAPAFGAAPLAPSGLAETAGALAFCRPVKIIL